MRVVELALLELALGGGTAEACRRCLEKVARAAREEALREVFNLMEREGVGEDARERVRARLKP